MNTVSLVYTSFSFLGRLHSLKLETFISTTPKTHILLIVYKIPIPITLRCQQSISLDLLKNLYIQICFYFCKSGLIYIKTVVFFILTYPCPSSRA